MGSRTRRRRQVVRSYVIDTWLTAPILIPLGHTDEVVVLLRDLLSFLPLFSVLSSPRAYRNRKPDRVDSWKKTSKQRLSPLPVQPLRRIRHLTLTSRYSSPSRQPRLPITYVVGDSWPVPGHRDSGWLRTWEADARCKSQNVSFGGRCCHSDS